MTHYIVGEAGPERFIPWGDQVVIPAALLRPTQPKEQHMFTKDLFERVVRTFIVAFLVPVLAGWTSVTDVATAKALAWAGAIAGGTAVLALLTKAWGSSSTASVFETPGDDR